MMAIALAAMLATFLAACSKSEQQRTTPAPPVRTHRTIAIEDDGGPAVAVRDLESGEALSLADRNGMLLLRSDAGVIDTLSISAATDAPPVLRVFDSSFVELTSVDTGAARRSIDLVVVAEGELHWAARMPSRLQVPARGSDTVYTTAFTLVRTPRSVRGAESYESSAGTIWSNPFELRFDDSARVFYNVSVGLDSVPLEGSGRPISGQHPGIVLRSGTIVFVDGAWRALSTIDDLDPVEFAAGTVGLVLDGRGEWGDTLRTSSPGFAK